MIQIQPGNCPRIKTVYEDSSPVSDRFHRGYLGGKVSDDQRCRHGNFDARSKPCATTFGLTEKERRRNPEVG
jgi:hypothetical protein